MSARILTGNVFDMLPTIAPGSVDCCVTSPPYWMLRSYLPKGHALKHLELGSEKTPAEYVAAMARVFGLVRDCLADHGTCWLNVGDTYTHAPNKRKPTDAYGAKQLTNGFEGTVSSANAPGIDSGNLCLIPWRLAIALQDNGWVIRSVIVWHKPAPMPASLTGWRWVRCRVKEKEGGRGGNGHARMLANSTPANVAGQMNAQWSDCPGCEKCEPNAGLVLRRGSWRPTSSWEPILMLAKSAKYFCDGDAVKQPAATMPHSRGGVWDEAQTEGPMFRNGASQYDTDEQERVFAVDGLANLRDVWTIAAEPLRAKHYAAYPTALVERCLRAGTSARGYCPVCGKPWCRVVEGGRFIGDDNPKIAEKVNRMNRAGDDWREDQMTNPTKTIGWRPSCSCPPAEPRPGRVLDPFAGSGRTGIAANRLGLDFTGVELNPEYAAMAEGILRDANPLFHEAS